MSTLSSNSPKQSAVVLPPAPPIFYGRDELVDDIVQTILLSQKSAVNTREHIVITGDAGIGKTSIGLAIFNDSRIAKHFGDARHWVWCDQPFTIQQLLEHISDSLADIPKSNDRLRDVELFLQQNEVPRIIGLDNFETIWDPLDEVAKSTLEQVLFKLASIPKLTLLLTTRSRMYPANGRVRWHKLDPIEPLHLDAARETFMSISKHVDDHLDDVLRAIDYVPLAVVLLASYGQVGYTTSQILDFWNREQTRCLEFGEDRLSSLNTSIRVSLHGSLMRSCPDALTLLSIVACLPCGIKYDNLEKVAPLIDNVYRVATTTIQTSLMQHSAGVLRMHSTVRSYMLHYHPLDASHKSELRAFYFQLIEQAGHDPETGNIPVSAVQMLYQEESNAQAIILDALEHSLDTTTVLASTNFSNYLISNIPRLEVAKRTIEVLESHPSSATDALLPLCWLCFGKLYLRLDEYPESINATQMAEKGYRQLNQSHGAAKSSFQLAEIYRLCGKSNQAIELITKACKDFEDAADTCGMSSCHRQLAIIHSESGKNTEALQDVIEAQKICPRHEACIMESKLTLGRMYRESNPSKAIELLTEAREYFQLHGPLLKAAICLYQRSIAHLLRKDYEQAEAGLNEAREDFKRLGNHAQVAFCIYYQAGLHSGRGSFRKALELYEQARVMFEQMGNIGSVGFCLRGQGQALAKLRRVDDAMKVYGKAVEQLGMAEGREAFVEIYKKEMLEISEMRVGILDHIRVNWYYVLMVVFLLVSVTFSLINV